MALGLIPLMSVVVGSRIVGVMVGGAVCRISEVPAGTTVVVLTTGVDVMSPIEEEVVVIKFKDTELLVDVKVELDVDENEMLPVKDTELLLDEEVELPVDEEVLLVDVCEVLVMEKLVAT